jgi:autotransporter-associated beta strand protein
LVSGSTTTTTDPDTATFNAAISNTWGNTALNPVVINSATQNIKNISFDTSAGAYFIGSTGGNPLLLTTAGTIQILSTFGGSNTTETINAPLVFEGNYSFANAETTVSSDNLVFGGNISAIAGNSGLTISGAGTNTGNQISGNISNGTATALSVAVTATAGTWTLSGSNSYTGATTINGAGSTTILSGVNSSAGATTLTAGTLQLNNTTANDGGLASGALSMGGGSIVVGSAAPLTLSNTVSETNGGTISGAQSLTFNGIFTNTGSKTVTNSLTGGSTLTFAMVNLGTAINSSLNFEIAGAANTTFGGVIEDYSGGVGTSHGNLEIFNSGTTTLSGANTYGGLTTISTTSNAAAVVFAGSNSSAGTTTVTQGTVQFDNASNGGIASGLLTLAPTNGGTVVTLQSLVAAPNVSNNITLAGNTTVSGANSITLSGVLSQTASAVTLTSSITGGGTLTLSGANLNIDQVTGTAQTLSLSGAGNTTISSAIQDYSGGAGTSGGILAIASSGTTTLSGANTYTGLTTYSGNGTMITAGSNSSAGAFTLNTTSGTLQLDNATNGGIATGLLTLTKGTLQSLVANQTLSNAVTLGNVTVAGANSITLNGAITQTTSNTLTSSITGGNTLTLGGNVNIDQVTGTGRALTIAGTGNTTISGVIQDFSGGPGTAHGALAITNTGITTLSAADTYGGATTLSAGTLIVSGSLSGSSSTTVTNATLAGTGSITGPVTIGNGTDGASTAAIQVGSAGTTGTLSTGALTLKSDAVYKFNLNPTLVTSDLLNVTGAITLGSGVAALSGNLLSDKLLGVGVTFAIAQSTTPITGNFAGLPDNTTFNLGDNNYTIHYGNGDGITDEITLTTTAVPEPQTWAMMIGSFGMLVGLQRMRRRSNR